MTKRCIHAIDVACRVQRHFSCILWLHMVTCWRGSLKRDYVHDFLHSLPGCCDTRSAGLEWVLQRRGIKSHCRDWKRGLLTLDIPLTCWNILMLHNLRNFLQGFQVIVLTERKNVEFAHLDSFSKQNVSIIALLIKFYLFVINSIN